jgi:hypothetical protein
VEFLSRRHSNLGSGPPRGPGHYSEDGRRWWEDGHRRWFPATGLEDPSRKGAWATEQRARLEELHQRLLREGWRPVGPGDRWWSRRYRRPVVDLTETGTAETGRRPVG